jgi:hypothetical protein
MRGLWQVERDRMGGRLLPDSRPPDARLALERGLQVVSLNGDLAPVSIRSPITRPRVNCGLVEKVCFSRLEEPFNPLKWVYAISGAFQLRAVVASDARSQFEPKI